jgi:hypothetical protein
MGRGGEGRGDLAHKLSVGSGVHKPWKFKNVLLYELFMGEHYDTGSLDVQSGTSHNMSPLQCRTTLYIRFLKWQIF